MAERATVFQTVQSGLEVTPGTPVAAAVKWLSFGVNPSPRADIEEFTASGQKYTTTTAIGREWSEHALSGRPVYDEVQYLFASILGRVTATTPGTPAAADARNWQFTSAQSAADNVATYTIEQGSTDRGQRFKYSFVTELGFTFTRSGIEISGSMMGQEINEPFTLTSGGVTSLPQMQILPRQVDVFLDDTAAGLGTTQLLRCVRAEWRVANRFGGVWPLNSTHSSFAAHVETKPEITAMLRLAADAQGMALLTTMRNGSRKFLRIRAQGSFIDAATAVNIVSSTNATPIAVTATAHGLTSGDTVVISGHLVNTAANGTWTVTAVNANSFTLNGSVGNGVGGATGTVVEQLNPYLLQIDQAIDVIEPGGYQDEEGLYCFDWTMRGVYDGIWTRSHRVTVQNTTTAL